MRPWLLASVCWSLPMVAWVWAAVANDAPVAVGDEPLRLGACWAAPFVLAALVAARLPPRVSLALAVLVAAPVLALRPPPGPGAPTARAGGPSLVLVTLDTFRGDHLSSSGGPVATPSLDALATSGASFRRAVTTAPLTAPSHATLMTGLAETSLRANGRALEGEATLAEELHAAGYRTGAFVSASVLSRSTGLSRGFEHYDDRWGWQARHEWLLGPSALPPRSGAATVGRALRWWRSQTGPVFLWVHLYDPHGPYLPADPDFVPDPAARRVAAEADRGTRRWLDKRSVSTTLERGFVESQKLMYRAEIAWTDHLVGELLGGIGPDPVVVVVGDHGESLDEHGYYFNHGGNLLEPSMHVPLVLRWPGGVVPGTVVDRVVGTTAVAPTLRAAAGLPPLGPTLPELASGALAGPVASFTPGMQAHPAAVAPHAGPQAALRGEGWKLVVDAETATWYDLVADPRELTPLPPPSERAADVERLREGLVALPPLGPDEAARLRELGYVE